MTRVAVGFILAIALVGCRVGEEHVPTEEPENTTCRAAEILIQAPDSSLRVSGLDTVPVWEWHDLMAERFAKSECDDLCFTIPMGPIALWGEEIEGLPFLLMGNCRIMDVWPHRHFHLSMEHNGSVKLHKERVTIKSIAEQFYCHQIEDAGLENSPYGWVGAFLSGSRFEMDSLAAVQSALTIGIARVFETRSQQRFGIPPCELPESSLRALAGEHPVSIHLIPGIPWEEVPKGNGPKNAQQ